MKLDRAETFDEQQRSIIAAASDVARQTSSRAYLVGGPVRDALLRRRAVDLDFAVEGDARSFAYALAGTLGARVVDNEQFLTSRLELPAIAPIDVVTCRAETYAHPGALPTVRPGSIRDDLLRRDFSINALAVRLADGELIDVAGGERDLEQRKLRVLHDASFVDDPTRIYRGVRIATRLGLAIDEATSILMRNAIDSGALRTVSKQRLWRELQLAVHESGDAVAALAATGALRPLIGAIERTDDLQQILKTLTRSTEEADASPYTATIAALLSMTDTPESADLSDASLKQQKIAQVIDSAASWRQLRKQILATRSACRQLLLIAAAPPEARALAASSCEEAADALALWRQYRSIRIDESFSERVAAHAGRRTRHYIALVRLQILLQSVSREEAQRLAETALVRYLRARKSR